MKFTEFVSTVNAWGADRVPFFFLVDFEMEKPLVYRLDEINRVNILFSINGFTNTSTPINGTYHPIKKTPEPLEVYLKRFEKVYRHLGYGDTFLTNLTIKTQIELEESLLELFMRCHAKYKLWFRDQFLVFSPETFIQIRQGKIFSYPMKGTIEAHIPNAAAIILNDIKETAEHVTIIDLIRNDLSQVASEVTVNRFRFVDEIRTNQKNLLQVSSEIAGKLPDDYHGRLGDILMALLPAGSVSGAPKPKTLEVIREAEQDDRGYYTGVFGYFDGTDLDSGVMIRYIEKCGNQYFYRSGGGITAQSVAELEYKEALDKIYVPVD